MKLNFLLGFLFFYSFSFSQNKFRVDYNNVSFYDFSTDTWSDWKEGDNTFIININDRGDIAHLKANGETVIYRKLSGAEERYAGENNNYHFQIIDAFDEEGNVFKFQLFDDTSIGLKMIWDNVIIQFAKSN